MIDLKSMLKDVSLNDTQDVAKAEDLQQEGGTPIDWSKTFFEPEPGNTYILKFLPNLDPNNPANIVHRRYYKLPNPDYKGKYFQFTSKGKGCPVLELFFELNALSKAGDVVAETKIKKYLTSKRQAIVKVQILSSPNKEEIGNIRLLRFQSYGDNAVIGNMLNAKLNPAPETLQNDPDAKENIFNIFSSSVMSLVCKEATFEGVKGRSFAASTWLSKKRGAFIRLENGETHEFTEKDLNSDGSFTKESEPFVEELIKQITSEDVSIYKNFEYKEIGDPRNSQEMNEHLKKSMERALEIVNVLRTKSLQEIANYGRTTQTDIDQNKNADMLKESIPDELKDLATNTDNDNKTVSTKSNTKFESNSTIPDVDELLN